MTTGERLKEVRTFLGLKQKEFSNFLGIRQNYLSRYESGEHDFPDGMKVLLVKLVQEKYEKRINIDWLLTGDGEMFLIDPSPQSKKPPLITNLEELISENLKPLTNRIEILERSFWNMNKTLSPVNRNLAYDLEVYENPISLQKVLFVENIAAGPFLTQSENIDEYIEIPNRYLKAPPNEYFAARIKGYSMTEAGILDCAIVLIRQNNIPKDNAIQVVMHDGQTTLKRMRRDNTGNWKLCYEDGTGKCIEIQPNEEYHILGDFVAVLPEKSGKEES
jgi:SOS-response transcriptional repressor LexA